MSRPGIPTAVERGAVGIPHERYLRVFHEFGGTYLGLLLAEELSAARPVTVPRRWSVPLAGPTGALAGAGIDDVPWAFGAGFVIKYSGHREGFSRHCVRGIHS